MRAMQTEKHLYLLVRSCNCTFYRTYWDTAMQCPFLYVLVRNQMKIRYWNEQTNKISGKTIQWSMEITH